VTDDPEQELQRRAQALLDQIPGYRGYRLKEQRRDADRRVREAVASAYEVELARVERIGRDLAKARRIAEVGPIEEISQRIRLMINRIRAETPGYGGLFSDNPIDGVALDQLRLFDESLMQGVVELREQVDALERASGAGETLTAPVAAIAAETERELLRLSTRAQVVESGRAVSSESALAVLGSEQPALPAPDLGGIRPGDAVSILGTDYAVDAVIAVKGRPDSFELARLSRDPEEWLVVPAGTNRPVLRVRPAQPAPEMLGVSGANLVQVSAGTGDGEIVTAEGPGTLRAVRYALLGEEASGDVSGVALDWDGERQSFVGEPVEAIDIEVYRKAPAQNQA
jgi:hypothetical protein